MHNPSTTRRRDRLPSILLEFENTDDRQQFLSGMIEWIIERLDEPNRYAVWAYLKQWRMGGSR